MAQYSLYRPWASGSWSLLDQFRREMDALSERGGALPAGRHGVYPLVNLYETADAYVLTAELPGVDPADVKVSLEGTTLTLQGERRIDYESEENVSLHRRERQGGSFRRAFELPAAVNADKVEAVHRNGVLMMQLPKTPDQQPRQIAVQAS